MINPISGAFPMSSTIGYARVSTTDQDLGIQIAALKREGCTTIRSEKKSGTSTANREELRTVLDFLREGDVLMVTRIDRLARSIGDLQDIIRAVRARCARASDRRGSLRSASGCTDGNNGSVSAISASRTASGRSPPTTTVSGSNMTSILWIARRRYGAASAIHPETIARSA